MSTDVQTPAATTKATPPTPFDARRASRNEIRARNAQLEAENAQLKRACADMRAHLERVLGSRRPA